MPHPEPERPLVTFILLAYNQQAYVRAAIEGAFAQSYDPMEIILSDDCSNDRTFEIMQDCARSYTGSKTVIARQNQSNLGLIAHVNTLLDISKGELIMLAAGDDISLPERAAISVDCYLQKADRKILIHGDATDIDIYGTKLGLRTPPRTTSALDQQAQTATIDPNSTGVLTKSLAMYIGATGAISKSLLREFEPIRFLGAYEDMVWGFRAVLHNALHYLPQTLVQYRIGVGISGTGRDQTSFRVEMRQLYKSRRVTRDVLSQRLIDLKTVPDNETITQLRTKIAERLAIETQCVKIHDRDMSLSDILTPVFAKSLLRVLSSTSKIALKSLRSKITNKRTRTHAS